MPLLRSTTLLLPPTRRHQGRIRSSPSRSKSCRTTTSAAASISMDVLQHGDPIHLRRDQRAGGRNLQRHQQHLHHTDLGGTNDPAHPIRAGFYVNGRRLCDYPEQRDDLHVGHGRRGERILLGRHQWHHVLLHPVRACECDRVSESGGHDDVLDVCDVHGQRGADSRIR
jgi:hypothetical protein